MFPFRPVSYLHAYSITMHKRIACVRLFSISIEWCCAITQHVFDEKILLHHLIKRQYLIKNNSSHFSHNIYNIDIVATCNIKYDLKKYPAQILLLSFFMLLVHNPVFKSFRLPLFSAQNNL